MSAEHSPATPFRVRECEDREDRPLAPWRAAMEPASAVKYRAIYADPPWHFRVRSPKGEGRSATRHYPCMTLDSIRALPIGDLAATDSALFLWATDPMLPQALSVIEAWGFTFKTVAFHWVKSNRTSGNYFTGMGYWTRANPEQCLLATRGSPKRKAKDVCRLVVSARREHSRKPDEVRSRIERLVDGPYLELFARQNVPGWAAWGNEVDDPIELHRLDGGART